MYLPPDDRRHEVYWSEVTVEKDYQEGDPNDEVWKWYDEGNGFAIVAHYLLNLDLSDYSVKTPPPKTEAFWEMAMAGAPVENVEIFDLVERIGSPPVLTIDDLVLQADEQLSLWMRDRKNARAVAHRLEDCGYRKHRNPSDRLGTFSVRGKRKMIYTARDLGLTEAQRAVESYLRDLPF
jgi:hypothetical protein